MRIAPRIQRHSRVQNMHQELFVAAYVPIVGLSRLSEVLADVHGVGLDVNGHCISGQKALSQMVL